MNELLVINNLLQKEAVFLWVKEQQAAFETLKDDLNNSVTLQYPVEEEPIIIDTDASKHGLGVYLLQKNQNGKAERPLAFASCTLTCAEKWFSPTELEGLAVIYSLVYFRHLLFGCLLIMCTDHKESKALIDIKSSKHDHLYRWRMQVMEFQNKGGLMLDYKKGSDHQVPDTLSSSIPDEEQLGLLTSPFCYQQGWFR